MDENWNIDDMEVIIVEEPQYQNFHIKRAMNGLDKLVKELHNRQNLIEKYKKQSTRNYIVGLCIGAGIAVVIDRVVLEKKED